MCSVLCVLCACVVCVLFVACVFSVCVCGIQILYLILSLTVHEYISRFACKLVFPFGDFFPLSWWWEVGGKKETLYLQPVMQSVGYNWDI